MPDRLHGIALAALRVVLALLMLGNPLQKLAGFPEASRFGLADPLSLVGVAGMIETVTGLLLLVGLFTQPAAFVLSGTMAAGYFIAHQPREFFPIANGDELAIMFRFAALLISATPPDPWTLDARRRAGKPLER